MFNKRLLKEGVLKKLYIPAAVLSSILNSAFTILNAYLLALIVDSIFIKKLGVQSIKNYTIMFLANAALKSFVNFIIEGYIKNCSEDIKEGIRRRTFSLILSSNPYKVKNQKLGETINILTDGIENITPYFSQYIPQAFASFLIPLIICIAAASRDMLSAAIMLITYPIIPFFMRLIGYKSKEVNERQWKKLSILSSHFIEMLQGLSTLKLFGRSNLQEEKVFQISEEYRKSTMDVLKISFLSALVLELSATISTAVLAVNLGLRLVYSKISFLNAFFILILAPEFYIPMRQLGMKFHASLNGQVAIEKIQAIEDSLKDDNSDEMLQMNENIIDINVNNLSFSHDEKETLNNLTFEIHKGEKVAIVGESGSGKTTLVNILSGFLKPQNGMVFINGIDINKIDLKSYFSRLSIVPQFPHIFNMSIEDNVSLGKDKELDRLSYIYEAANIKDFAAQFEYKYDALIGDGEKIEISGGEKQRIAAARVLAKDSDLVILDEPTSALDSETEEMLSNMLRDSLKEKTVLIAAHRLNTIKNADKIMVLKQGRIVEFGSPETLMQHKGMYYEMITSMEGQL
ncbi:thiol reductant ABC exporter subunit CydD [Clostridium sp. YIM B02515]|uniref:Thiol reductant ABC exporter subunit CydD n=1 Tax=Clostridium rhizosphaerae TaxID=2803861 RepID=A0ABS1T649_9CLOT|nr:thiol reductant ABC exporter subunit CydD [Clostridium rhizosphaerae]MBL4934815.1 thiol reductant ABC exporter subunit CydD [Clostridium rhizosphaerae]